MRFYQRRVKRLATADMTQTLRFLTSFTPDKVEIFVRPASGSDYNILQWFTGMANGSMIRQAASNGARTLIGTNGITVSRGDKDHSAYIELGSDANLHGVNAELIINAYADPWDEHIDMNSATDVAKVGTIPSGDAATFNFTDGQEDDINWLQRSA